MLRADWAAAGTVFEIFLPDGVQARLNCLETDEAAALDDASWMTDDQRAAFLTSYDHAPYENVGWDAENAGLAGVRLDAAGGRRAGALFLACFGAAGRALLPDRLERGRFL